MRSQSKGRVLRRVPLIGDLYWFYRLDRLVVGFDGDLVQFGRPDRGGVYIQINGFSAEGRVEHRLVQLDEFHSCAIRF